MTQKPDKTTAWKAFAFGLAMIPFVVSAQTVPAATEQDWRDANDAVGKLQRGHVDVLKWEAANLPPAQAEKADPTDGLPLRSIEEVTRQVWRAHLDLATPLAIMGTVNVKQLEAGHWAEVDPSLHRRVEELDEILALAAQARKSWLRAIAARQVLAPYFAAVNAAEAANELGQRMVSVGNWSRLQQTQVQLAQSSARMNLVRAQYAARQAEAELIETLKLKGQYDSLVFPESLPEVPDQLAPLDEWQQREMAIQAQLPGAEARRNRANTELALAAYQLSHEMVKLARDEVKVREFIGEETLLRYNGMLASVWDLLDESRNRSQAVIDAIDAQRDFWIAEADLQWVLLGGEPDSFVALGGGAESAAAAGH
ncbi:MAG: hypothetical protein ABI478_09615 [Propionivibrio sp.]